MYSHRKSLTITWWRNLWTTHSHNTSCRKCTKKKVCNKFTYADGANFTLLVIIVEQSNNGYKILLTTEMSSLLKPNLNRTMLLCTHLLKTKTAESLSQLSIGTTHEMHMTVNGRMYFPYVWTDSDPWCNKFQIHCSTQIKHTQTDDRQHKQLNECSLYIM